MTAHIPLVATGLLFLYLAVRLARVSRLSGETSLALLTSADAAKIVVAAIIPAGVAALFALLFTTTTISIDYALIDRRFSGYHAFTLIVLAAALVVVPVAWLLFLAVADYVYLRAALRATRRGKTGTIHRGGEIGLGIAIFVFLVATTDMWLPPERISFVDRPDVVAYWIGEDASWTTLMMERSRQILIVQSDALEGRQVCDLGPDPVAGRSLLDVLLDRTQPEYAPCFPQPPTDGREPGT